MEPEIDRVKKELAEIAKDASVAFGGLDEQSLNWKPAADSWSVAQCLDHLLKTTNGMEPAIDTKISGGGNSFFERVSPFSGFFGNYLKKVMITDSKKVKAPSKQIVPPSEIDADIVARFCEDQKRIINKMDEVGKLDWDRTVITSPFLSIMTYRLRDAIDILVEHQRRHLRQAKRVVAADGFPVRN